jgi:two-component system, chemotaxis family, chemotaxis protein CheY
MVAKRVLSVGQCFADHSAISRTLQTEFGVEVVPADDAAEALARLRLEPFDLVLVNRILDRDGSQGVELIKEMKADLETAQVPVMLVSNYEDSQRDAVAAGAVPGFGKSALGHPQMLGRVKSYLS